MEDLDRHFSHTSMPDRLHRITMAKLLNCLDGISTAEGVIVIATANDPSKLDPAILSRPGRFDRVMELKRPSADLRNTYIQRHLNGNCDARVLERMIQLSDGFSFAQLRETYILAGQLAYDRSGVVTETEMLESIEQLSSAGTRSKANGVYKKDVGFGSDRSGRLVQPSR
jgi:ATP-dependent 26S proteasome regulatory subunit